VGEGCLNNQSAYNQILNPVINARMYSCMLQKSVNVTCCCTVELPLSKQIPYSKKVWWIDIQNRFGGENSGRLSIYTDGNQRWIKL